MEIKSMQDFFIKCSIEVFDVLFKVQFRELQKNIETKNIIKNINPDVFYHTVSVNCRYGNNDGNLIASFSRDFLSVLKQYSDEDVQKYYDQMDHYSLYTNFIGILLYSSNRELRLMNHTIDFDIPIKTKVVEVLRKNRILLFLKDDIPLVYLGVSFDN